MKRSIQAAGLLFATVPLMMTLGCRKVEMQRCVDQQNIVVDDDLCHATGEQRILGEKPAPRTSYRYYYGGTGSTESGTLATGGSYLRLTDHNYVVKKEHQVERHLWPLAAIVGAIGLILFFGWEGRNQRP